MTRIRFRMPILLWVVVAVLCSSAVVAEAAITREQRQELVDIRRDLSKVSALLRQKKQSEAEKLIDEAEDRLQNLARDAGLEPDDRVLTSVNRLIERQRKLLGKANQPAGEPEDDGALSFTKDIAPVFAEHCVGCHGENPKAGLQLNTFAGMEQGGRSGPLLVVGQPGRSLLIARLTAPQAKNRMPKNRDPLPREQMLKIAAWITQGAKFDGNDKSVELSNLTTADSEKEMAKVEIARATGDEKVSFTKDIAPFMANLCLRCHGGNEPRSGFSIETFQKLMIGGDSGQVVVPGDLDASRLWDLVGKQDPIKMPQGPAVLTRDNWNDLKTWILEGAKFDGDDPQTPLRKLVPSQSEMKANELAKLSPAEFAELRRNRTKQQWEQAIPRQSPATHETAEFLFYGDVDEQRLQQVTSWGEQHAKRLREFFGDAGGQSSTLFSGRLAVFVIRDRFFFDELHRELMGRPAPREVEGFARVAPSQEDALIAVHDAGDDTGRTPGPQIEFIEQLTAAYMARESANLPEWLVRGTGLALAAQQQPRDDYFDELRKQAAGAVRPLREPVELFNDRGILPEQTNAVGFTLVDYLLRNGGNKKFLSLLSSLDGQAKVPEVIQRVYGLDPAVVARAYAAEVTR